MMLRLLLVRHGETEWNAQHRYQGQSDVPLSDAGRAQARALVGRLAREPLAAAYVSDLRRAVETAEIILAGRDVPLIKEPRLREMNFGTTAKVTMGDGRWGAFSSVGQVSGVAFQIVERNEYAI